MPMSLARVIALPILLAGLAALVACTRFPEIDAAVPASVYRQPYPRLLPIEDLVASVPGVAADELDGGLAQRLAALKARAARLRGPVIPPAEQQRLEAGVHWPA